MYIHACAARPVDDDRLACLVYIVLHAKVGRHPVDQHTVVRRHVRELLKGTERDGECVGRKCQDEKWEGSSRGMKEAEMKTVTE